LNFQDSAVAVVGGGVTGLTAAELLARRGIAVTLMEKSPFLGGHAAQLACKAIDACVQCGACVVEEKLRQVGRVPGITVWSGAHIDAVQGTTPLTIGYHRHTFGVDRTKCDGCGQCLEHCPAAGALVRGRGADLMPVVAVRRELCHFYADESCRRCQEACPQGAIDLAEVEQRGRLTADAVLVATGFTPFDPTPKPYGYGRFKNVVTLLDLEHRLRRQTLLTRPSDDAPPQRMAYIQCVGSRDTQLGHNWCSQICCASALRQARLIRARQPQIDITLFYIDLQTVGQPFQSGPDADADGLHRVRNIPADIIEKAGGELAVIYFDPRTRCSSEDRFDMVVLSVGMTPAADNHRLADHFGLVLAESGFLSRAPAANSPARGIFCAGAVQGPMRIAESVRDASRAAGEIISYLSHNGDLP